MCDNACILNDPERIMSNHNVTVPASVLQDLIFNAGLYTAGTPADDVVTEQCNVLQACIEEQVGNCDVVYDRPEGTEPGEDFTLFDPATETFQVEELSFDDPNVVSMFAARKRKVA